MKFLLLRVIFTLFVLFVLGGAPTFADGGAIDQSRSGIVYWFTPTANMVQRTYRAEGDYTLVTQESLAAYSSGGFVTGNVSRLVPTSWPTPPGALFYQGTAQFSTFAPLAMVHVETVTPRWNTLSGSNRANDYSPLIYTARIANWTGSTLWFPFFAYGYDDTTTKITIQHVDTLQMDKIASLRIRAYTQNAVPTVDVIRTAGFNSPYAFTGADIGLNFGWNGSIRVDATYSGDSRLRISGIARSFSLNHRWGNAYEGQANPSGRYVVPVRCGEGYDTNIYIQSASSATVWQPIIQWYDSSGNPFDNWFISDAALYSGTRLRRSACSSTGNYAFMGYAAVYTWDQYYDALPIAVMAEQIHTSGSRETVIGFGIPAEGVQKHWSVPFARWSNDQVHLRTEIQIINPALGSTDAHVQIKYYKGNGSQQGNTINEDIYPHASYFTDPGDVTAGGVFGYYSEAGGPGGAIDITSDQPIMVFARAYRYAGDGTILLSEGFSGVPMGLGYD